MLADRWWKPRLRHRQRALVVTNRRLHLVIVNWRDQPVKADGAYRRDLVRILAEHDVLENDMTVHQVVLALNTAVIWFNGWGRGFQVVLDELRYSPPGLGT
jgi:hypothetical protein